MARIFKESFWWRFLWGLFFIPFIPVYESWRDHDWRLWNPQTIVALIVWELVVLWIIMRRQMWPFNRD